MPANSSGVREHNGKTYVVLENANGVLAVYRFRNDGMLKRLRRWPAVEEMDDYAEGFISSVVAQLSTR